MNQIVLGVCIEWMITTNEDIHLEFLESKHIMSVEANVCSIYSWKGVKENEDVRI